MAIEVKAQPLTYPREFGPPVDMNGMLKVAAEFTRYFISSEYRLCINLSGTVPVPEDRNKVLFTSDSVGRPVRVSLFYNGNFRRVYSGFPFEVRIYTGAWTANFDVTGLGILGSNWDGWALCNGQNGTTDFSDRFVISGNNSQGGGWYTYLSGPALNVGGAPTFQIQLQNLPPVPLNLVLTTSYAGGGLNYAISTQQGDPIAGGPTGEIEVATAGTGKQTPISTLPVYVAFGFAEFIGYQN